MNLKAHAKRIIVSSTPWLAFEAEEEELSWVGHRKLQQVHILSHGLCIGLYGALLVAFFVYAILVWQSSPVVETFSTGEALRFGPVPFRLEVECPTCVIHRNKTKKWTAIYNYTGFKHCGGLEVGHFPDEPSTDVKLCRTSDDIRDPTGIRVWIGNVSEADTEGAKRIILRIIAGDDDTGLRVTVPLMAWHEKTVLLGLTVHRNSASCEAADCALSRQLYLNSMQYDGKVDWGGESWGGAQLNVRLTRFAHVYTVVPAQSFVDVVASVGGASGILVLVLGFLRKVFEILVENHVAHKIQAQTVPEIFVKSSTGDREAWTA